MAEHFPVPPAMLRRARDFRGPAAAARAAATVALLRDTATTGLPLRDDDTTVEVYVLRRAMTMVFGGVYAFPGGGVDPAEDTADVGGDWSGRLGVPAGEAGAVVAAAVREVCEETTVRLRPDALLPWARWITPEFEPRRFDTWFFVAALPAGQEPRDVSGEADRAQWIRPADALARHAAQELLMLPPTLAMLQDLAAYPRIAAVVAAAADRDAAQPVTPRIEFTPDGGATLRLR